MRKHASFSVYSHQNTVLFTPWARQGSAGTGSHENARFGIAGAAQTTPNAPHTPLTLMWRADTPPCKFTDAHGPLRHLAPTAVTRPCHVAQGLKKRGDNHGAGVEEVWAGRTHSKGAGESMTWAAIHD